MDKPINQMNEKEARAALKANAKIREDLGKKIRALERGLLAPAHKKARKKKATKKYRVDRSGGGW